MKIRILKTQKYYNNALYQTKPLSHHHYKCFLSFNSIYNILSFLE